MKPGEVIYRLEKSEAEIEILKKKFDKLMYLMFGTFVSSLTAGAGILFIILGSK